MSEQLLTETNNDVVERALLIIDGALSTMLKRELVGTNEVANLLLDVRTTLAPSVPEA